MENKEILKELEEIKKILNEIKDLLKKNTEKRKFLTDKQVNYILYLAKQKNISNDFLREILKEIAGVEKVTDIDTREKFEKVLEFLKK